MANKKISKLPLHTLPHKDDLFVTIDSTSVVTKKITLESIMASPGNIGTLNPGAGRFTIIQLPGGTEITASSSTGTLTISTTNNQLLLLGDAVSILGIVTGTCLKIDENNNQVSIRVSDQDQVLVDNSETVVNNKLTVSGDITSNSQIKANLGLISRADVGDYGGNFTNYTPPTGREGLIIIVVDTNSSSPGQRLYAYVNSSWNYVDLIKLSGGGPE